MAAIYQAQSFAPCYSSRPLGTLVISLQQLQSAGHLVLREALVDERLQLTPVSATSLSSATLRCLQTEGLNEQRGKLEPHRSGNKHPAQLRFCLQPLPEPYTGRKQALGSGMWCVYLLLLGSGIGSLLFLWETMVKLLEFSLYFITGRIPLEEVDLA